MNFFRTHYIKGVFGGLTLLVLFNMSVSPLELVILKMYEGHSLEPLEKVLIDLEEESETKEGSSEKPEQINEVDLYFSIVSSQPFLSFLIGENNFSRHFNKHPLSGILNTITQPPEAT